MPKGTHISPNRVMKQQPGAALPRREQYMWPLGQIYAEAMQTCLQLQRLRIDDTPSTYSRSDAPERKMRIQAPNTLTASALQEFQRQYQRFRCSVEMKYRRMQTCPGVISGKSLTERHHKPPHASEPEQKPQKPPQLTE